MRCLILAASRPPGPVRGPGPGVRRFVQLFVTPAGTAHGRRANLPRMRRSPTAVVCAFVFSLAAGLHGQPRTPTEIAAKTETASSATYRYRTAIAALLQLKPGMVAAELGPGSGFVARAMAPLVAPDGRVVAAAFDREMAAFIVERAKSEGLQNVSSLVVQSDGGGLQSASLDAVAIVSAFGNLTQRREVLQAVAAALKPGGALVIVDLPAESMGEKVVGIDADEVVQLATTAGLKREAESTVVPGHYAIRFRKP
jgi:predicted methyltransferase